jgi:hypothetical protein
LDHPFPGNLRGNRSDRSVGDGQQHYGGLAHGGGAPALVQPKRCDHAMHRPGDQKDRPVAPLESEGEPLSHPARAEYGDTRSRHAITPLMDTADTHRARPPLG